MIVGEKMGLVLYDIDNDDYDNDDCDPVTPIEQQMGTGEAAEMQLQSRGPVGSVIFADNTMKTARRIKSA